MARLLQITAWAVDSTVYSSASPMALQCDSIKTVRNASLKLKQSVPAASGLINSVISLNLENENSGENHTFLVQETQGALITASA